MGITVDIGTAETGGPVREVIFAIILVLLLLIGFGAAYIIKIYYASKVDYYRQELAKLERELQDYKIIESTYKTKKRQIELIKQQAKTLRELKFDPLKISFILRELPGILPTGGWISNLSIEPKSSTINFSVQILSTRKALLTKTAELLDKVSNNKFFYSPEIGNISIREQNGLPIAQFSVRLKYKVTIEDLEEIYKIKSTKPTKEGGKDQAPEKQGSTTSMTNTEMILSRR